MKSNNFLVSSLGEVELSLISWWLFYSLMTKARETGTSEAADGADLKFNAWERHDGWMMYLSPQARVNWLRIPVCKRLYQLIGATHEYSLQLTRDIKVTTPNVRLACRYRCALSDGSTPHLFGLTINQCHIHLVVVCDKMLWIPCPLKLDMSDDNGDSM